jgi:hypothetical protein
MSDPRYDKHYLKLAHKVLSESKHIPDFACHGSDPDGEDITLGDHWGFTVSTYRDANLLAESNWEVISADMLQRFPKSVVVDHCKHWAYGWMDHLTVRMIDSRNRLTMAGIAILDWQDKLDNYPIASEDDYSRREFETYSASMRESVRDILWFNRELELIADLPDNWQDSIIEHVRESGYQAYDRAWDREGYFCLDDYGIVIDAARTLGFVSPDPNDFE